MTARLFLKKEKKQTLKARAENQLRNAIMSGELQPGTRLVEQELSELLGISRLPIREALNTLENEGLVTIFPYKGAFVSAFGQKEISEIFSVRELIELHSLKLAMAGDCSQLLEKLESIVEKMDEQPPVEDIYTSRHDFAFHCTLCEFTGNKTLHGIWKALSVKTETFFPLVRNQTTPEQFKRLHTDLLQLIKQGDYEAAAAGFRAHLQFGQDQVLRKIQTRNLAPLSPEE